MQRGVGVVVKRIPAPRAKAALLAVGALLGAITVGGAALDTTEPPVQASVPVTSGLVAAVRPPASPPATSPPAQPSAPGMPPADQERISEIASPAEGAVPAATALPPRPVPAEGGGDRFAMPLPIWSAVTDRFGAPRGPELIHGGIDLALDDYPQTPVLASCTGTVLISDYSSSYGNYVVIDCGDGWSTLYGHLSEARVEVDDPLAAGEVLGISGSTGFSTGEHLHFEIRWHGTSVNPEDYLDFKIPEGAPLSTNPLYRTPTPTPTVTPTTTPTPAPSPSPAPSAEGPSATPTPDLTPAATPSTPTPELTSTGTPDLTVTSTPTPTLTPTSTPTTPPATPTRRVPPEAPTPTPPPVGRF